MDERRLNVDCRMLELRVHVAQLEEKLVSSEKALFLAKQEIDRRLEGMNELRQQITSERGDYLGRKEFEGKHQVLINEVDTLQRIIWMISGGLIVFQIFLSMMVHFWH